MVFVESIMPVKSRCTHLKLCGSINDASWDDEYRIVQGENRSMKSREAEQREAGV